MFLNDSTSSNNNNDNLNVLKQQIDEITQLWFDQKDNQANFNKVFANLVETDDKIISPSFEGDIITAKAKLIADNIENITLENYSYIRDINITSNVYATIAKLLDPDETALFNVTFKETTTQFGMSASMIGSFNKNGLNILNLQQTPYITENESIFPITGIGVAHNPNNKETLLFITHHDYFGGEARGGFINALPSSNGFIIDNIVKYGDISKIKSGQVFLNISILDLNLIQYQKKQYKDQTISIPYVINDDDKDNEQHYPTTSQVSNLVSGIREDLNSNIILHYNTSIQYTDDQITNLKTYVDFEDISGLQAAKDYANGLVLGNQIWLPAVQTYSDLPTSVPDSTKNYLCRVINDPNKTLNGVYQWIVGAANWTYFSDNSDFLNQEELDINLDLITVQNQNAIKGPTTLTGETPRNFITTKVQTSGANLSDQGLWVVNSSSKTIQYVDPVSGIIDIESGKVDSVNLLLPGTNKNIQIDKELTPAELNEALINPNLVQEGITYYSPSVQSADTQFMIIPDYSNMETTNRITTNYGTWTVDRNGFVYQNANSLNADYTRHIYINEKEVVVESYGGAAFGVFPVKIGDIVRLVHDGNTNDLRCYYIPPKAIPIGINQSSILIDNNYLKLNQNGLYSPKDRILKSTNSLVVQSQSNVQANTNISYSGLSTDFFGMTITSTTQGQHTYRLNNIIIYGSDSVTSSYFAPILIKQGQTLSLTSNQTFSYSITRYESEWI